HNTTSVTAPAFTGATAPTGSTVTIFSDGVQVGSGTAAAYTSASGITISTPLGDGAHTITAKASDGFGNTSAASSGLSVTIDSAVPVSASVTAPVDRSTYQAV